MRRSIFDNSNDYELEGYDTAQVCVSGHAINEFAQSAPQHNQEHCEKCGAETIVACPKCSAKIRGHYHAPGVVSFFQYSPPAFCHKCGDPYPWTRNALKAARELALELDGLTPEERESLSKSVEDLVRDTPTTPVSMLRFKKLMPKAGKAAAELMKKILFDVATEAVRKQVWGA